MRRKLNVPFSYGEAIVVKLFVGVAVECSAVEIHTRQQAEPIADLTLVKSLDVEIAKVVKIKIFKLQGVERHAFYLVEHSTAVGAVTLTEVYSHDPHVRRVVKQITAHSPIEGTLLEIVAHLRTQAKLAIATQAVAHIH